MLSDEAPFTFGQVVTYRFRSVVGEGVSEWSEPLLVTFNTQPIAPVDIRSTNQGNRNGAQFITVNWSSPAGAVVDVERDGEIVSFGDDNNVLSDEAPFTVGQVVTYRFRSVVGEGVSEWSEPLEVTFTTPPET